MAWRAAIFRLKMWTLLLPFVFLIITSKQCSGQIEKPNIVFILIDDLGWNDVGFRGSTDVRTPNLDALADEGVVLNKYYTYPMCTPSRAAILTGRYTANIGMQHYLIRSGAPWGLPLSIRILPQYLKPMGYTTALIGKWHLGFHRSEYTPLQRGFDYHFGYWPATMDYFEHTSILRVKPNNGEADATKCGINREIYYMSGNTLIENTVVVTDKKQQYSTDVFNKKTQEFLKAQPTSKPFFLYLAPTAVHRGNFFKPVKSPDEYASHFNHINNETRRQFAGALMALDNLIGDVIKVLHNRDMLSNSVIVLASDNGADTHLMLHNGGSNWPLRGEKFTPFEGGVRTLGLVWSPLLKGRENFEHLAHASDWLPTLYSAAGGNITELRDSTDGFDLWGVLGTSSPGPRKDILIDLDTVEKKGAFRDERFKMIFGRYDSHSKGWNGRYDELGPSLESKPSSIRDILKNYGAREPKPGDTHYNVDCGLKMDSANLSCSPETSPCLFDMLEDPCEYHNVASEYPQILSKMLDRVRAYEKAAYPPQYQPIDPEANPNLYGGRWVPWLDPQYATLRATFPGSFRDHLCTNNASNGLA